MEDMMLHYAFRAKFPSDDGIVYSVREIALNCLIVTAQPVGGTADECKEYEVGYRFDGDSYFFDEKESWKELTKEEMKT